MSSLDEPGLVLPPAFPVPGIGGLYGDTAQQEADARRRETDRLLEKRGLKPRRW